MQDKFKFPSRGFYFVESKVKEADYFLDMLEGKKHSPDEFSFILNAFASAARSITFSLQSVMSHYPNFEEWYQPRRQQLKENKLAKFFVELRNFTQKVGGAPIMHTGTKKNGKEHRYALFFPSEHLGTIPPGDIVRLAQVYYTAILRIIKQCYEDYAVYVDPRKVFTVEGLLTLGWSIEDLEESCGLPRGWTDIDEDIPNKSQERLRVLRRECQKEEEMEYYFKKYKLSNC